MLHSRRMVIGVSFKLHGILYKAYNWQFEFPNCSREKTVNENLKMSAALLSRFDLVFILLDKPDELLDKRVSEHIMSVSASIWKLYTGTYY